MLDQAQKDIRDAAANAAILSLAALADGEPPILAADQDRDVYLIPSVIPAGEARGQDGDYIPASAGPIVEYQVSDGLPGDRSTSFDFLSFTAARTEFERLRREGWEK
jgi:hypothetical protein